MAKPEGGHVRGARNDEGICLDAGWGWRQRVATASSAGSGPARDLDVEIFDDRLPGRCGHDVVELRRYLLVQLFDGLEDLEA
jgi:hypothetical protein